MTTVLENEIFKISELVKNLNFNFNKAQILNHLPEKYIEEFVKYGADGISVHYEGNHHIHSLLQQIRNSGAKAGLALNPHTPVSVVKDILHLIDTLLIMSVNPGFGGQKFITESIEKVAQAQALIQAAGSATLIEVDGGVNTENAIALKAAGAAVLVAGSAVFKSSNPKEYISQLMKV